MAIKKYSKVKFTLRKELIFILAAVVVLVVATILLNLPNEKEKFINKWQEAGSQIQENTIYEEISFDGLLGKLEASDEYTFVLFATPNAECVEYFDAVMNYAANEKFNVSKVYLVDSALAIGDRENDEALDNKLTEIENQFKNAEETIKLDSITNFWVFKGTELVGSAKDYADVNNALSQLLSYGAAPKNTK
jgi:hypothetical protein